MPTACRTDSNRLQREVLSVCRAVLCFVVLGLLGACRVHTLDDAVFACKADADCAAGERCLEQICRSPTSLSGGGPLEGNCETSCASEHKMCCGTTCVDIASDSANCGTCGVACNHAQGESCRAGKCEKESSCSNGLDDNGDGLVDCQDTLSCPSTTSCYGGGHCCNAACVIEGTAELCSNGLDDDCNGLIDCADSACHGQTCGKGQICDADGRCGASCFIDGRYYAQGAANPDAPCLVCDAGQNTHDWVPAAQGSVSGACSGFRACDDNGQCRRAQGQPCGGSGDCSAKSCAAGICL
jgi:hypothetical protein